LGISERLGVPEDPEPCDPAALPAILETFSPLINAGRTAPAATERYQA
jgi:hypothetical protein